MKPTSGVETLGTSRRTFIKASGLAAISTIVAAGETAKPTGKDSSDGRQVAEAQSRPVEKVNILQGTESSFEFSRGNTLPIAALPFGMAHWTVQTHADTPWMFQPGSNRFQGFRCTHQLSPWLGDYGHATFLPFCGDQELSAKSRGSSYNPQTARLKPYSLQLFLQRYRAKVELIPTERCAVIAAEYESSQSDKVSGILFDIPASDGFIESDLEKRRIQFKSTANAGGVTDNFATYYVLAFERPWKSVEIKNVESHQIGVVRFLRGEQLVARIGTSFISYEQAELNLEREIGNNSIKLIRESAADRWNEHLRHVEIEGGSNEHQRTFYSCLYRTLLFPRIWHEPDALGQMRHFSAYNGKVMPGVMYADHGYWDVYRAWYPLMSVLFPERLGEILQAWVNAYKEGGWMPQFPAPGYRACMTGSLIDSVFADAAVKGITGFDLSDAYEGIRKHATLSGKPESGFGRSGLELYLKHDYLPANLVQQSVAETVDAAYGDFCIAQVAKVLDRQRDYAVFMKRSENWRHVFDPQVKFLRGKNANGTWVEPFNQFLWGSPYVEGSAWQHRWDVPHDIQGIVDAVGGKAAAVKALDEMMACPPIFDVGVYGTEIHEMSEMASVDFGQYAQSNQPVHHLLYIFAQVGRADRTQFWVRKVMNELFTPETFPGDEDTGSMSAWFIMSALGFYPVCPGKAEYTLGSPLFSRAILHLQGKKKLIIEAHGNSSECVYVRSTSLNGKQVNRSMVEHAELMRGGTLSFMMSSNA